MQLNCKVDPALYVYVCLCIVKYVQAPWTQINGFLFDLFCRVLWNLHQQVFFYLDFSPLIFSHSHGIGMCKITCWKMSSCVFIVKILSVFIVMCGSIWSSTTCWYCRLALSLHTCHIVRRCSLFSQLRFQRHLFRNIVSSWFGAFCAVHYAVKLQVRLCFVLRSFIFRQWRKQLYCHCGMCASKVLLVKMNHLVLVLICLHLSVLAYVWS